ncbi:ComEA family DNA-binding protein [Changchengzhania lutea]|uniref:ComEA family DNA-binding protein n=1 Tax=Changchengzhania lutea TaxID=2049305 RepID=UPI00115C4A5B|nr:helix-hairpin-helix domain-containing protein [Changchengzhania lutea]
MKLKSHVTFSKEQRRGIFFLILIIIILQCVYLFGMPIILGNSSEDISDNREKIERFTKEVDSLRHVELAENEPKIFPFNPNYITDYKGSTLGMSNEEIDRLLNFRAQNKWVNSAEDFQKVTHISDSLLKAIAPYFKFPEWATNSTSKTTSAFSYNNKSKSFAQKSDLNTATIEQLQRVNGIGEVLSERIIKFRNKFEGGFIADVQLQDVYGLSNEVIESITNEFTVKTPRPIQRIKLNAATMDELVTVQHIDYDLAHDIIEQRQLRDGYKSLDELKKVKGFPFNKFDIIKLYLSLD